MPFIFDVFVAGRDDDAVGGGTGICGGGGGNPGIMDDRRPTSPSTMKFDCASFLLGGGGGGVLPVPLELTGGVGGGAFNPLSVAILWRRPMYRPADCCVEPAAGTIGGNGTTHPPFDTGGRTGDLVVAVVVTFAEKSMFCDLSFFSDSGGGGGPAAAQMKQTVKFMQ